MNANLSKSNSAPAIYRTGYTVYERVGRVSDMVAPWPMTRFQAKKRLARLQRRGRAELSLYRCESYAPPGKRVVTALLDKSRAEIAAALKRHYFSLNTADRSNFEAFLQRMIRSAESGDDPELSALCARSNAGEISWSELYALAAGSTTERGRHDG